ncbi:hypothetical protein [Kaarinaea lacus]
MKTKIQRLVISASLALCFCYISGCTSSSEVWVKQSEMTEHSVSEPQGMENTEQENIPAKTMKEGTGYE